MDCPVTIPPLRSHIPVIKVEEPILKSLFEVRGLLGWAITHYLFHRSLDRDLSVWRGFSVRLCWACAFKDKSPRLSCLAEGRKYSPENNRRQTFLCGARPVRARVSSVGCRAGLPRSWSASRRRLRRDSHPWPPLSASLLVPLAQLAEADRRMTRIFRDPDQRKVSEPSD